MRSNDYLPMGTWDGDPSAPWNQNEQEPKDVIVSGITILING